MRKLFLLRGVPASAKSTWVRENNLEPYTISADNVRLLFSSPELQTDGTFKITQKNDKRVWDFIHNTLEDRMSKGEMLIVDATHYKQSLLQPYKSLANKYRYRLYVVDFTNVELDELLRRNKNRKEYQVVPDEVIIQMYNTIKNDTEVSKRFKILTPDEALAEINDRIYRDCNSYNKLVFIGDIHGCYEPLKNYFTDEPMSDNNLYVFTGDYIDRGIQNKEVLDFLISIYKNDNVILLTGNHEKWLSAYCDKDYKEFKFESDTDKQICKKYFGTKIKDLFKDNIKSEEFINGTVPQIKDMSMKDLRELSRKFIQCCVLSYNNKNYVVTHGGIPTYPTSKVSTIDIIKGTGSYPDIYKVYEAWENNFTTDDVMIHAHRNIQNYPIRVKENIFNLCDTVEFGGNLRILTVTKDETKELYYKNTVFKPTEEKPIITNDREKDMFDMLQDSKLVTTKKLIDNIVSFNFNKNAFHKSKWNELTVTARGLFVDLKDRKIIARSYNKFFNLNEREETTIEGICKNITLPVRTYKKENGFLGIVSLYNDKLFVCSKSTNTGDYAQLLRDTLVEQLGRKGIKQLKQYLRNGYKDKTFVFECINKKDRHIIDYPNNEVVLLDIFDNTLEEVRQPISALNEIAYNIGCRFKTLSQIIETKQELVEWINKVTADDTIRHEGYVAVGENGFKFKIKSNFYKKWKYMRSVLQRLQCGRDVVEAKKKANREQIHIIQFMQTFTREELQTMDIIDIRQKYDNTLQEQEIECKKEVYNA